jgi:hypothetical protein
MELQQEKVHSLLFGQVETKKNLEAIIMLQGSIDIVITLDEIAALPDQSDRAIALQMMLEQIKGKK